MKTWKTGDWSIAYSDFDGAIQAVNYRGETVIAQNGQLSFDLRLNGSWQVDEFGCDYKECDTSDGALTLKYAVGNTRPPYRLPQGLTERANLRAGRELLVEVRFEVGEAGDLRRRLAVTDLCTDLMAAGIARRFEGFLYQYDGIQLGEADDCEINMPGPQTVGNLVLPRIPMRDALSAPIHRGSAPDGEPGVFLLRDKAGDRVLSTWIETIESCYTTTAMGVGGGLHLSLYERCEHVFLYERRAEGHWQTMAVQLGGYTGALKAYGRYMKHVSPPVENPPAWLKDAVFMEVDTLYVGGFKGLREKLPAYREMGINALYLMPINEGSYGISDHYNIDPRMGTEADLIDLMDEAHRLGMHVLLDLLIVIMTRKAPLLREHPEYFIRDENGRPLPHEAWSNASTDYGSPGFREYVARFAEHCVGVWKADGFRVDAAAYKIPNWTLPERRGPLETAMGAYPLLNLVSAAMKRVKPEAVLLNEIAGPMYYHNCDICHNFGFIYQLMDERVRQSGFRALQYKQHIADMQALLPDGVLSVYYVRNHDTAWFYRFDGYTPAFFAYEAIHCLIRGIPLIFSGQTGKPQWIGPEPQSAEYYKMLFAMRREHPVLINGACLFEEIDADSDDVFSVIRARGNERVIGLVNTSGEAIDVQITVEDGLFTNGVRFADALDSGGAALALQGNRMTVPIKPYGVRLLLEQK